MHFVSLQDCLVPSRYEDNLKLGKWVETQRYEYTKLQRAAEQNLVKKGASENAAVSGAPDRVGVLAVSSATGTIACKPAGVTSKLGRPVNPRLTEDRLRRLESIGFEWKVKHKMKRYYDKQWDQMFERLLAFKAATGHCMVPKRYPPDMKLGTWVSAASFINFIIDLSTWISTYPPVSPCLYLCRSILSEFSIGSLSQEPRKKRPRRRPNQVQNWQKR